MALAPWSAQLRTAAIALAAMVCVFAAPAPASAQDGGPGGWELCNQTSFVLEAATGRPEGQSVVVQGWTRIRPGECRLALDAPLKPGVHFVFARSSTAHRGGQRVWNGDVPLCVDPNGSFAVESPSSCVAMGLEQRGFQAVRIDKRGGGTMTFRETNNYRGGGESAVNAGIQRLLDDAGVQADVVDGTLNRESRAAIATFLAERKLPASMATNYAELIDILEDVARNRSLEVGMMLCNRTDNKIESAIGRQNAEGWQSRGWWTLEPGMCVRAVDESLITTPHYVFAEMETPTGMRHLTGADTPFCTSRSKFAILGRENCEGRRYRQDNFAQTAVPEDGKLVYEFFDRGFGQPERKKP
jgi:uncharacterized membrane protein